MPFDKALVQQEDEFVAKKCCDNNVVAPTILWRVSWEIRRSTLAAGSFTRGQSPFKLATPRLQSIAATRWGIRVYMDMERFGEARVCKKICHTFQMMLLEVLFR